MVPDLEGSKIAAFELFDDVPHTEHAVTLFNQDFRHAGQTDDLTISGRICAESPGS